MTVRAARPRAPRDADVEQDALSPIDRALVRALVASIVRDLKREQADPHGAERRNGTATDDSHSR